MPYSEHVYVEASHEILRVAADAFSPYYAERHA